MSAVSDPGSNNRLLRILSGRPDPAELAAVTVVFAALAAAGSGSGPEPAEQGGWSDLSLRLGRPVPPGPGAWRASTRR